MKKNNDKLIEIGEYQQVYNDVLNIDLPLLKIFQSSGLYKHIANKHSNCLQYFLRIAEILTSPDYIGSNPNEPNSIELIKVFDDNIQIGIKLDTNNNYYYISTMHEVKQSKIQRRLFSGRLKFFKNT